MIIIFGTRNLTKNYGVVNEIECHNCHNKKFWSYIKTRLWFTLFWIPVIPLGGAKHYILCPVCNSAIILEGSDREKYEKMAKLNSDFLNGKVSEEEYREQINKGE